MSRWPAGVSCSIPSQGKAFVVVGWALHFTGNCLNVIHILRNLSLAPKFENHAPRKAQVKIEVTRGQKVNFEKTMFFFDDNLFDFKDRTTIMAASCLSRQGTSKHI